MHIQPEIDKIGASLCNKSVSNIPPVMFAVFGKEDEVFWRRAHQLLKIISGDKSH